ncbi:MAG: hypothetical protein QW179_00055 [Candidatus Hadarchaeales archaeon]
MRRMACFIVPGILAVITTLLSRKTSHRWCLGWLNALLWGGVVMLAVEHIAHGEVVPYPPFLTAGLSEVLPEMLGIGVPMTISIVALWGAMVGINLKLGEKFSRVAGIEARLGRR